MQNLKSKYEHREMKVSDSLWDRLEEKLDQVPAKEEKPKMIWWRYAAAVILIFGLSGIFWMTNKKVEVDNNQHFVNQSNSQNVIPTTVEQLENNKVEKLIPTKNNQETDNQKLAIKNINYSTSEPIKKPNQITEKFPEKELIIKKEEPQIVSKPEEQLAQTDIQKPREKVKYVSSSDLLFGVEIDKAKTETPKSAIGINTIKPKNDSDFPNPKRIKLFGITLYDKDSITTK